MLSAVCLATAGCDKLPWSSPTSRPAKAAKPATPSTPSAVVPTRPFVPQEEVLAIVNEVPISKQDMEFNLQRLKTVLASLNQPWTPPTAQDLEKLLEQMVSNELMSQDAVARGLDRVTETQRRWEFTRRDFFVQEWLRRNQEQLSVGDAEIDKFYEENKPYFRVPERRQLRQLIVTSGEQAKAALVQLLEGVDFVTVAKQMSMRPEAAQAPLAEQWTMRSAVKAVFAPNDTTVRALQDDALEQAAFAIDQVDGVSSYVKGPDGHFHIFQLAKREEERWRGKDDAEVRAQIKAVLTDRKLQETIEALRAKAKIQRFPERLEAVVAP